MIDSSGAALGGLTTDTGVDYAMFVTLISEPRLQQSGPGLVNVNTVARAQTVAEDQDSRSIRTVAVDGYQQQEKG